MTTIKELFELSKNHPYYCSDQSYFDLGFDTKSETWKDFDISMGQADEDMNLVFRWDVKERDDEGYYMEIFMVHQRKGRFVPFMIESVTDKDVNGIISYLKQKENHLLKFWQLSDK